MGKVSEELHLRITESPPAVSLEIVGGCPACGAPVYGRKTISESELPYVRHSCNCKDEAKTFRSQVKEK